MSRRLDLPAQIVAELDRQHDRRRKGTPTLTLLIGAPARGAVIWQGWARGRALECVVAAEPRDVDPAWRSEPSTMNEPPDGERTCVLIAPPLQRADEAWVERAIAAAANLLEQSPRLDVAIVADAWTPPRSATRAATLAEAGRIELSIVAKPRDLPPPEAIAEDAARSHAERLLFAALEAQPWAAGRFELNGRADFLFGGRRAEIDLVSRALGLAIEIDGYHHFRDHEDYRRDRRKDVDLQRHGFLVVRVLALDVTERIDEVLATIAAAVRHRLPGGVP